ncbi:hypothetical protein [Herbaspirillum sp. RV1423]|uniref:hypothetical protein n=1 Tax=Herbaspirillum sp. RV1423 TaxID=1443993 RepID=UPI0004B79A9F|nr:hypothetical protein [Herbaspirillum sp. RV1423]
MPKTNECEESNFSVSEKKNAAGRRSCWGSGETTVEDPEDAEHYADAEYHASWLPDRRQVSERAVHALMEQFTDALKSAGYVIAESILWENTAEVLSQLDRGEIAPSEAMLVVEEEIRRTKLNSGFMESAGMESQASSLDDQGRPQAKPENPAQNLTDLEIVFENLARDIGAQAIQTFLTRIVWHMGGVFSGALTAAYTLRDVIDVLRRDQGRWNRFFAGLKMAATLLIGTSAHAAAIEYLRTLTPGKTQKILSEIDRYGEEMKGALSSPAALMLMGLLAVYARTLDNTPRAEPRRWGVRAVETMLEWRHVVWSACGWIQSFLKLSAGAAASEAASGNVSTLGNATNVRGNAAGAASDVTTVQLSAGHQNSFGEVYFESTEASSLTSAPNATVEATYKKERIGADHGLQSAIDGKPSMRLTTVEAINLNASRLSGEARAVVVPNLGPFDSPRRPNPLLHPPAPAVPADHRTYVEAAVERWANKTEQFRVIHVEFHKDGTTARPYLAQFEVRQVSRDGTSTKMKWAVPCSDRHKEELLAAVRPPAGSGSAPISLSAETQELLEPAMRFFSETWTGEDGAQANDVASRARTPEVIRDMQSFATSDAKKYTYSSLLPGIEIGAAAYLVGGGIAFIVTGAAYGGYQLALWADAYFAQRHSKEAVARETGTSTEEASIANNKNISKEGAASAAAESPSATTPESGANTAEQTTAASSTAVAAGRSTEKTQGSPDLDESMQADQAAPDAVRPESETEDSQLDSIVLRQIRHEYRVKKLPAANAQDWGTIEDNEEERDNSIERISANITYFSTVINETFFFDKKPPYSEVFLHMRTFEGGRWGLTDARDIDFSWFWGNGYSIEYQIFFSESKKLSVKFKISKKGEEDCTVILDGDKETVTRVVNNFNLVKNNLSAINSRLKGEKAQQYRFVRQGKIVVLMSKINTNGVTVGHADRSCRFPLKL